MDREALTTQMKSMYVKAKAARKEGKKDLASSFRAGGRRLRRKLKANPPPPEAKKTEEA